METLDTTIPASVKDKELIAKLSNRELELLRERAKKLAMKSCDDVVQLFVECSRDRLFSTVWACRGQLQEMNDCVKKNNNPDNFEKLKLVYVRSKDITPEL